MRNKYSTEIGINAYVHHLSLLQQKELSLIKSISPSEIDYHIYMICQRPRISINPKTVIFTKDEVAGVIRVERGSSCSEYSFKTRNVLGTHSVVYESNYPFNEFSIKDENGIVVADGKVALMASRIGFVNEDFLDLEVLYVGQSFGTDGKKMAENRLLSHSTLQKIYSEISPDKEVWIVLCNFEEQFTIVIDGRNNSLIGEEEDNQHFKNILDNPITNKQRINFIEAGLIKYFNPKYNKVFSAEFPNKRHSSYCECYDLDLNQISIVVDSEAIYGKLYSDSIEPRWVHLAEFPLHSKEERKNMFNFE